MVKLQGCDLSQVALHQEIEAVSERMLMLGKVVSVSIPSLSPQGSQGHVNLAIGGWASGHKNRRHMKVRTLNEE